MFKNLFKRKVDKSFSDSISVPVNVETFFRLSQNLFSPNELISKIGGRHNFDMLKKDEEIYASIDKRLCALLDTKLVLKSASGYKLDFFEENILPFEDQLKKDFWWTVFYGYGVEQILYRENGEIAGFRREDIRSLEPQKDLIHVKLLNGNPDYNNKFLPYGKFVLTTNNGHYNNPYGDALAEKLIFPWFFKCNSFDLWMSFAKRFANGFLHGKTSSEEQAIKLKTDLEKAIKSFVLVTSKDDELILNQPNRDASFYKDMDEVATRKIQRVILGETLTSPMQERGGSVSSNIHNEVRLEKTRADIKLIESAINEIILQVSLMNGFVKDESFKHILPKAFIIYDPQFNLEIAQRDATLSSAGIKFNKKYFIKNYGFDEDDFEIKEENEFSSYGFSVKNNLNEKKTFLSLKDTKDFLGSSCCPHNPHQKSHGHHLESNSTISRRENKAHDEVSDIVDLMNKYNDAPLDIDVILSAIEISENEQELDKHLLALMGNTSNNEILAQGLYLSAAKGALLTGQNKNE